MGISFRIFVIQLRKIGYYPGLAAGYSGAVLMTMLDMHIVEQYIADPHGEVLDLGFRRVEPSIDHELLVFAGAYVIAGKAEHLLFRVHSGNELGLSRFYEIAVITLFAARLIDLLLERVELAVFGKRFHRIGLGKLGKQIDRSLYLFGRGNEYKSHRMAETECESISIQSSVTDHKVAGDILLRCRLVFLRHPVVDISGEETGSGILGPVHFVEVEFGVIRIVCEILHSREEIESLPGRILPLGAVVGKLKILVMSRSA